MTKKNLKRFENMGALSVLAYVSLAIGVFAIFYFFYFYEELYLSYLPNYEHVVEFREYDIKTGECANCDTAVSDDPWDYMPFFIFLIYVIAHSSLNILPLSSIFLLILSIIVFFRSNNDKKRYLFLIKQIIIFFIVVFIGIYITFSMYD